MNCKQCNAELTQEKGKREKVFCNSSCRSKYWHKNKHKGVLIMAEIKPVEPPKVAAVNITPEQSKEVLDGAKKAKLTRADVKALVPLSIKGFDRTEWINTKCNELGIK